MKKLISLLLLIPSLAWAQYGGLWNTPERYNAAAVAITGGTISGVGGDTMSSDAAARSSILHGSNAYPQATVNTTGGDAKVCAGIGRRLFTIVDYSLIDAIDTVTVTVNGSASVKTAGGTDWTAATSNAATATSLATAISAISGVTATASGSSVYITPAASTCTLTIATSMDAGEGTATSGTDGTVTVTGATPQDATYWTSSSNATLTNETNLGALTTGLVLNTVAAGTGTPSAYGGTSCTNQFPRSISASGAATCASVANDDLAGSIAASKLVGTDIATVGTVTAGTWNAGVLGPEYGGTGIANDAAATLTRSGSHALTITTTGATNITVPTSGTVLVSGGALGTPASGTMTNVTGIPNSATTATSANTASAIVARDASGFVIVSKVTTDEVALSATGLVTYGTSSYSKAGATTGWLVNNAADTLNLSVLSNAGAWRWHTYGVGTITSDASGNLTAVSDERIKRDIRPFTKGLAEIVNITPILYGYTKESGLDQTKSDYAGFSAQNVRAAIPEAVGKMRDVTEPCPGAKANEKRECGPRKVIREGELTLNTVAITAALVNAVKEQQGRIEELEKRLAAAGVK